MHPIRRMEAIRSTLLDCETGAAEIRAAARLLEGTVSVGRILEVVVDPEFPRAAVRASLGCEAAEETAWVTIAAAGSRRARQVLAWRASQLLDPAELVEAAEATPDGPRHLEEKAGMASHRSAAAAWRLLARLSGSELKAMLRARPALAAVINSRRGGATGSFPALGVA